MLAGAAVLCAVCGAGGAFGGHWLWQAYTEKRLAAQAAQAEAAARAERATPRGRQREALRRQLHDPSSAVFRSERASKLDPLLWCGEVNAKNQFGAMVGFRRYYVMLSLEAPPAEGAGDSAIVRIDPAEGERSTEQWLFDEPYKEHCKPEN